MRPVAARWFEVLTAHRDAPAVLAALAATGAIELELRSSATFTETLTDLRAPLTRYAELARRFAPYWPSPETGSTADGQTPRDVLLRALGQLSMWHSLAAGLVAQLQSGEQMQAELDEWKALLSSPAAAGLPLELLAGRGPVLARCLYLFARPPEFSGLDEVCMRYMPLARQTAVLVILPHAQRDAFHRQALALQGRAIAIPRWLHGDSGACLRRLEQQAQRQRRRNERLQGVLRRIAVSCRLPAALGDIERVRWFAEQVQHLPGSVNFAWITGWTAARPGELERALRRGRHPALVRYPPAPPGADAPLVLRNPRWIRPFELFARALGMPARSEVDPSPLLALVVPLLFGYMFGDVGQGAVLVIAGIVLGRRWPALRLLVAGGLAAIVFGLLFGSVFSRADLLVPLWHHPPDAPLTMLGIPLLFGAVLLAGGQLLNGLQSRWRGALREWLAADAGLLFAYLAAALAIVRPAAWPLVAAGLGWAVVGLARRGRSIGGWLAAIGTVLEKVFQLAINTLSFARVGAFALAHAGLSSAIVVLASAAGHPLAALAVMLAGNVVVLVLETLVVGVQTTRLVLFEFFIRFLKADGRAFRPLPPPQTFSIRRLA